MAAAAAAGGAASAVVGSVANKLLGGSKTPKPAAPLSFTGGGYTATYGRIGAQPTMGANGVPLLPSQYKDARKDLPLGYNVTADPTITGYVNSLSDVYKQRVADLTNLSNLVTPGIGKLTEAGQLAFTNQRARLNDARLKSMGDLRENLARRRVLGSSFAADDQARTGAEYSRQENDLAAQEAAFKADAYMKELSLKTDYANQISQAATQQFMVHLQEAQFEAGIGMQLATGGNAVINNGNTILADLYKTNQAGAGSFLEPYLRQIGDATSSAVTNYMNQPSTSSYSGEV